MASAAVEVLSEAAADDHRIESQKKKKTIETQIEFQIDKGLNF